MMEQDMNQSLTSSGCVLVVMKISGALVELYGKALTLMSLWHTGSGCVIEMLLIIVIWRLHKMYRTDMIAVFGMFFKILFVTFLAPL